jgi:hypothetical protein
VAVDTNLTGKTYPSYRYEVSREKIREYATALGETDGRYFSDGDDCVAPPTFAAGFTITKGGAPLFLDTALGMHWNLVHGTQRFEFGRHVRPGDVLTCTPRFGGVTVKGANEFVSMEVECLHVDGELAVRSSATIVLFGSAPVADAPAPSEA